MKKAKEQNSKQTLKSKIAVVLTIILIILAVFLIVLRSIDANPYSVNTENISPVENNLTEFSIVSLEDVISQAAKEVAQSHTYELNKFDCTDFSKELAKKLRNEDIKAYCVYGYYEPASYPRHTWVEVDPGQGRDLIEVESTGGFIIPKKDFEEHYHMTLKGKCL